MRWLGCLDWGGAFEFSNYACFLINPLMLVPCIRVEPAAPPGEGLWAPSPRRQAVLPGVFPPQTLSCSVRK